MPGAFKRALVVGDGAVGGMLGRLLSDDGCQVTAFDLRDGTDASQPPAGAYARALRNADLVVLSLPEPACHSALRLLTVQAAPLALVVDTTSVKSALPPLWARPECPPALSVNPMFKPGLAIDGRPCLVVDPTGPQPEAHLSRPRQLGTEGRPDTGRRDPRSPVCRHPGERARRSACLRAGAQLIGYPDRRRARGCAPLPCRCMLLLLARISGGVANVYEDIQTANPFAAAARDSLRAGLSQLDASLSGTADFSVILGRTADWLGVSQDSLAEQCCRLFDELAPVTDRSPGPPPNPPGRR